MGLRGGCRTERESITSPRALKCGGIVLRSGLRSSEYRMGPGPEDPGPYFFEVFLAAVFFLVDLAVDFLVVFLEVLAFDPLLLTPPAVASRFSFLM